MDNDNKDDQWISGVAKILKFSRPICMAEQNFYTCAKRTDDVGTTWELGRYY